MARELHFPAAMHPRLRLDISWHDLLASLRRVDSTSEELEARVGTIWGSDRPTVVALSVRSAFDALLSAQDWPPNTRVAFSGVTIEHMVEIARRHRLDVEALDVDPSTLLPNPRDVEAACSAGARMVVITRLFGAVSPLDDLAEITRQHGALLVEDAAQAFAGAFHRGDPCADVALFSFGLIKRASALGGAVAVVREPELADAMKREMERWPVHDERWFRRRVGKAMLLKLLTAPPLFSWLHWGIRVSGKDPDRVLSAAARGFPGENLLAQIRHRPPASLLGLLVRRLGQRHDWRMREATQWHLYARFAGVSSAVGRRAHRHASWLVVLRHHDPNSLIRALTRAGFDATRAPSRLRAIVPGSRTAFWMEELVYLPHPVHLTREEEGRMAEAYHASLEVSETSRSAAVPTANGG